jgi:hypothetical protein
VNWAGKQGYGERERMLYKLFKLKDLQKYTSDKNECMNTTKVGERVLI